VPGTRVALPTIEVMSTETPTPRRRHLMDPNAPRRVRDVDAEQKSLTRVQRWVMSVLAVTTVGHLAGALVLAAVALDDPRPGARVGLCLIAGGFGLIAVVLARVIHGKKWLSPWLVLGLLPTVVGLLLI
jgi:hypothetical protein